MCVAIPAQIVTVYDDHRALVNIGGIEREISIALLDQVEVGEFVIVHVGYALAKLDQQEAKKTLQLFESMTQEEE